MWEQRCWVQLLTGPGCNVLSRYKMVGEGVAQLPTAGAKTISYFGPS
jgi:hypothetical protein